jgi:hypothetical protein
MLRATTLKVLTRGTARDVKRVIMPTLAARLLNKKNYTSVTTPDRAAAVETITHTLVAPSPGSCLSFNIFMSRSNYLLLLLLLLLL